MAASTTLNTILRDAREKRAPQDDGAVELQIQHRVIAF
jgi:hypothetical protein